MSVSTRRSSVSIRRRRMMLLPLVFGLAFPTVAATSASAASTPASSEASPTCRAPGATVGELTFRRLPSGLGARWDSLPYSYDDVDFHASVWESGSDELGWTVDLDITVMTGARLSSAQALHDWIIEYQERPADEVHYRRTTVRGAPGWVTHDQIFWLVRPGLAASVTLRLPRWNSTDLRRLVNSYFVSG